jgi:hypothetical protein
MKEVSIDNLLKSSARIIATPTITIKEELGLDYVDMALVIFSPTFFLGKKAIQWIKNKMNANSEKERIYKEIIAKQQAAINRQREINRELEKRLRVADMKNSQQQREVAELKKQISNLSDVLNLLKMAQKQVA